MGASSNLNKLKNYSLYASQIGNDFVKPSEIISQEDAIKCISRAHEQLQIAQSVYEATSILTGMTEEGLRYIIEMPVFQDVIQSMEDIAGPINSPPPTDKEQAASELTQILSNPTIQFWLNQFSTVTEGHETREEIIAMSSTDITQTLQTLQAMHEELQNISDSGAGASPEDEQKQEDSMP